MVRRTDDGGHRMSLGFGQELSETQGNLYEWHIRIGVPGMIAWQTLPWPPTIMTLVSRDILQSEEVSISAVVFSGTA